MLISILGNALEGEAPCPVLALAMKAIGTGLGAASRFAGLSLSLLTPPVGGYLATARRATQRWGNRRP